MQKTELSFIKPAYPLQVQIPVAELLEQSKQWQIIRRLSQDSAATVALRATVMDKFEWFLNHRGYTACSRAELSEFFLYLREGHAEAGGRWGNPKWTRPLRPCSIQTYHKHLTVFFKWLVSDEILPASPMAKIPPPIVRADQVQPYTSEEIQALLQAARKSRHKQRDYALVVFLLDTGLRASELCGLKMKDIDFGGHSCTVLGKGNKIRKVYFGKEAAKVLWQYLRHERRQSDEPLFLSDRGTLAGGTLTRSGLFQLIQRLGEVAGLGRSGCNVHRFRHTFAVEMLRNGANTFSLKELMGHTTLHMTNKYVALAQADLQNQHRLFSPADRLKKGTHS